MSAYPKRQMIDAVAEMVLVVPVTVTRYVSRTTVLRQRIGREVAAEIVDTVIAVLDRDARDEMTPEGRDLVRRVEKSEGVEVSLFTRPKGQRFASRLRPRWTR